MRKIPHDRARRKRDRRGNGVTAGTVGACRRASDAPAAMAQVQVVL